MKIVHVITRFIRAGADENTILTCIHQARAGHEVFLLHGSEYDRSYVEEFVEEVKFIRCDELVRNIDPLKDLKAYVRLRRIIEELRPDVVHTHTSKAGILGRLAAHAAGVSRIVHGVHIIPFANGNVVAKVVYRFLEVLVAKKTDAFINVSAAMRDKNISAGVGQPEQHHVVRSGFALAHFKNADYPVDASNFLGDHQARELSKIAIIMGVLVARKRQFEVVEAFKKVVAAHKNAKLLVVGEGEDRSRIEDFLRREGLQSNVILTGFRNDPARMIALSHVGIMASRHEGLPRVVMQYLAAGKPCVATYLPGIEEVVSDGVNGAILDSDDIGGLADTLIALFSDEKLLENLSSGARATDLSAWDSEVMGRDTIKVYEGIVVKHGRQN